MTTKMLAFHNRLAVQAKYVSRVEAHYAADEITQGNFWDKGKGCAVGCVLHDPGGNHIRYEAELGVPVQLAHLEDAIFESLPADKARDWPLAFMTAIPLGADLSQVWPQFAAWLMVDPEYGVEHTTDDAEIKALCREVASMYLSGDTAGGSATVLANRLWAAGAAGAAWDEWAAGAAWAARAAGAAWAARAAWDAWDEWAAGAAGAAIVEASADKLLELLANAPVREGA